MRRTLIAATGALMLALTLSGAGAAIASTAARAAPATVEATDATCSVGSPQYMEAYNGPGQFQWAYQDGVDLAFHGTQTQEYCANYDSTNRTWEFWVPTKGNCLAWNSTTGYIDQDGKSACNSNDGEGESYDEWVQMASSVGGLWFEYRNVDSGTCMYYNSGNVNAPRAILNTCITSNAFEFFGFNGG
jgi:hypothetical protein